MEGCLYGLSVYAYFVAFLLFSLAGWRPGWGWRWAARGGLGLAVGLNLAFLAVRWGAAGHPPLATQFEILVGLGLCLGGLALAGAKRLGSAAGAAALVVGAILAYAGTHDRGVAPLPPALRHDLWLTVHVMLCFLGYAGIAIGAAAGGWNLARRRFSPGADRPDLTRGGEIEDWGCDWGWRFLGLGVLAGSVWADLAWGSYWSWDPKESAALATLLILTVRNGDRAAGGALRAYQSGLALLALAAALFTYFGPRFFGGLHAYN